MNHIIKQWMIWLHGTLFFASFVPILMSFIQTAETYVPYTFIASCIIIFSIVTTDLASKKCHSTLQYIFASAIILIVSILLYPTFARLLFHNECVTASTILNVIITAFLILIRFGHRVSRIRYERDAKDSPGSVEKPDYFILDHPSFFILGIFFLHYGFGKFLYNPTVCNEAVLFAILYTVITIIYQYYDKLDHFLFINDDLANIPINRIYHIRKYFLYAIILLLVFAAIPTTLTSSLRNYKNMRDATFDIGIEQHFMNQQNQMQNQPQENIFDFIDETYVQNHKLPEWVNYIFYAIGGFLLLVIFYSALKYIFAMAKDFSSVESENGDFIETIEPVHKKKKFTFGYTNLSEREKIRKQYKQFIRKYRKDTPHPAESPSEIETLAGLKDNEDMRKLHVLYEEARYH